MKKRNPRFLIVFSRRGGENSTVFGGFSKRLQKRGGLENIDINYVALEDLLFTIDGKNAAVFDIRSAAFIKDYDWVYFKSWEGSADRAAALAIFLQANGIPFADPAVISKGNGNKLVSHMRFWAAGLPVAKTAYISTQHLLEVLPTLDFKYPLVIKAVNGQKGRSNFLANDYDEAVKIIKENADVEFLVQEHIPNTHDYRIQVYGGKASLIIQRMAQVGSHLNNTSAGGGAVLVAIKEVDARMLELAEKAADAVDLQVSGVDIMPNAKTGKYYVLEANQGSQIVTGKFTEENMAAFNKYLRRHAKVRMTRQKTSTTKLAIVGRHEIVDLPDFGIKHAEAKVDTGAYRSSIHAKDIRLVKSGNKQVLKFKVPTEVRSNGRVSKFKEFSVHDYDISEVKKSSTITENRYIIKTRLRLGGRTFLTSFTLTDRGSMRFPVLIGRRVLRGRFIVNPELSHEEDV